MAAVVAMALAVPRTLNLFGNKCDGKYDKRNRCAKTDQNKCVQKCLLFLSALSLSRVEKAQ